MMILVDTGPLYAFFNKRDQWNWWVGKTLGEYEPPAFTSKNNQKRIQQILTNYQNLPALFADACLVRMAEVHNSTQMMTFGSEFTIYRKSGGEPLNLISPF